MTNTWSGRWFSWRSPIDGSHCPPSQTTLRAFSTRRDDHRADSCGDEGRAAHLPRAGRAVSRRASTRTTRTARRSTPSWCQPECARGSRRARPPVRGRAASSARSTASRRSSRTTSRPSACRAPTGRCRSRVRLEQGCVPGEAHQGGRRDRAGQVEHGRVRVQPVRDGELDPARIHEESLRARPGHRRIRAAARPRRSPRTSARSASAATPATRFAGRRRIRRSSASDRRWG